MYHIFHTTAITRMGNGTGEGGREGKGEDGAQTDEQVITLRGDSQLSCRKIKMNITYIVYIKNTIMIVYYGQKGGGNTFPSPNTYNLIYPHCSQYCIMPIFTFHEIKLPCPLKQYSPYQHTDRLAPLSLTLVFHKP